MSMTPTIGTPDLVWQILTVLSLVYTSIFLFPYLLKMLMYPRKVGPLGRARGTASGNMRARARFSSPPSDLSAAVPPLVGPLQDPGST